MQKQTFTFNSLTIRIFLFFWLTLFILLLFIFLLPYFDAHVYSNLKENEIHRYENKIESAIQHDQFSKLLNGDIIFPAEFFSDHPILVSHSGQLLGMLPDEEKAIRQFMFSNPVQVKPLKRIYGNSQIVGPFPIKLSEQDAMYQCFFINRISAQKEILTYIFERPIFLIILVILISSPLLWWLSQSIGGPIRNLQQAANAVAMGHLTIDKNLEKKGLLELRQVGQSFNRMTQSLEDVLNNQRTLLSSISHELRTPLTRLQLATALLRRRLGENENIQRIDTEAQRLDKMINDLLQLSRQQLNSHLGREIFDIAALWEGILEDAEFEAEQKKILFLSNLYIFHPENYRINGNLELLQSAVENVIRNALKYTSSKIVIHFYIENHELVILTEDDGAGLPAEEYEKIFKPFYRVDEARTRTTGGTGLGLSIVAHTIKSHHGRVWANRSRLGGLAVTLSIPLWLGEVNSATTNNKTQSDA